MVTAPGPLFPPNTTLGLYGLSAGASLDVFTDASFTSAAACSASHVGASGAPSDCVAASLSAPFYVRVTAGAADTAYVMTVANPGGDGTGVSENGVAGLEPGGDLVGGVDANGSSDYILANLTVGSSYAIAVAGISQPGASLALSLYNNLGMSPDFAINCTASHAAAAATSPSDCTFTVPAPLPAGTAGTIFLKVQESGGISTMYTLMLH